MRLSPQEFIELAKCRRSPGYFLSTYGLMRDPVLGQLPFRLFRYQEICLDKFLAHAFNIILKSRQMGLSWLVAGYALWLCLFFEDKKVLMISIKDKTAKALLKKVKFLYESLPRFLQQELLEVNMSKMAFANGSEIESVPTSEDAGRSESISLLIVDEAAHVRWFNDIWMAAYPTLSTGGQAIMLSTPNGTGTPYHDLWQRSIQGTSLFNPIRLHWWYYPNRGRAWFEIQKANMAPLQLAQEILGDFIASGNLVFDLTALRAMQDECAMLTPYETLYTDEPDHKFACGLYLFEPPHPNEDYILCADTAKGGAGDYHGAHVIKRSTGEQVAEYRTRVPLDLFNHRLLELGSLYNWALAGVENNFGGVATNLFLMHENYPRIYEYENPLKGGHKDLGFPTNSLTRPILIDELETAIREQVAGVRGIRTADELMAFAWNSKGKAEAMKGSHDDLVLSYGIGRYIRRMSPADLELPMLVS